MPIIPMASEATRNSMRVNPALLAKYREKFTFLQNGEVNAFCFLQEAMSAALGIEPGIYTHIVGSLHSYNEREEQLKDVVRYPNELVDDRNFMFPKMTYDDIIQYCNLFWAGEYYARVKKDYKIPNLQRPFSNLYETILTHIKKKHENS